MPLVEYVPSLLAGGILMFTCFSLGKMGFSMGWIWIFVLLNFLKSKLWKQREKRLLSLRQTSLKEREVIQAQMQDLPAWVQFPDIERVEWINKVIHHAWPYIGEYVKVFMKDVIEPQVKDQMPSIFKAFKFESIDMGDIPLRVGGIKVYTENVGRDRIVLDMDVAYAGDSEYEVSVGAFRGGLNEMQFTGKLRAILKPLIPYPPMFGGVTAFFLDDPQVDFNLTGLGELVELPGLMGAIRSIVKTQIRAIAVLPNEIVVPLIPDLDVVKMHFPEPDDMFKGIVRVNVLEAKNLENKDMTFIKKGKSDPYAHVSVGSQLFKTKVIDDNLNPIWNESYQAVVDQAYGQRLILEVFDEDKGNDEELGRLALDLDQVRQKGVVDQWYPLEMCKHGDVHLKMYWMSLSSNARDLERQMWDNEWSQDMRSLPSAVLQVFVDCASNLPYPKKTIEPSPLIHLDLGKQKHRTFHKPKTVNPLFQQKFLFWVSSVDTEKLNVEAHDFVTGKSLGEVAIPVNSLLREENLEIKQQTYSLALQAHTSPIILTLRLRVLVPKSTTVDEWTASGDAARRNVTTGGVVKNAAKPQIPLTVSTNNNNNYSAKPTHNDSLSPLGISKIESNLLEGNGWASAPSSPNKLTYSSRTNSKSNHSLHSTASKKSRFGSLNRSHVHAIKQISPQKKGELGSIQLSVFYNFAKNKLAVVVHRIDKLSSVNIEGKADPYVQVRLISSKDASVKSKFKTDRVIDDLSPEFEKQCEFDVRAEDLVYYNLLIVVKDGARYGMFGKSPVLGRVLYILANYDPKMHVNEWFELEPPGIA